MAIYVIGDLHLSFRYKMKLNENVVFSDMKYSNEIYEGWTDYVNRLRDGWLQVVRSKDAILLAGDISDNDQWEDVKNDFYWIDQLPGVKYFIPGNHCMFANMETSFINKSLPSSMHCILNTITEIESCIVVGALGSDVPYCEVWDNDHYRQWDDQKDFQRYLYQVEIVKGLLQTARQKSVDKPLIVMLHYPPNTKYTKSTLYTELFEKYRVTKCVFGHLHGEYINRAFVGTFERTIYQLVSSDFLNFKPLKLMQ